MLFQETFTCARMEDSVACEDSPMFYSLNERFGQTESAPLPPASVVDSMEPPDQLPAVQLNDNLF